MDKGCKGSKSFSKDTQMTSEHQEKMLNIISFKEMHMKTTSRG
jgi:hypothetical protein